MMVEPEALPEPAVAAPLAARAVALSPGMRTEQAAALMLAECASQIRANAALVLVSAEPEAAHQLRIGLRRLRCALRCLAPVCSFADQPDLAKDAQWLGREVSLLRDLDVLLPRLHKAAALWPQEPGFPRLTEILSAQAADARAALRVKIEGERARHFLARLSDPGPCREQSARLTARDLGRVALDHAWKRARRLGRKTGKLDTEARHDLRKSLKHLRYTVEFFAPLFKASKVQRYREKLKRMQDLLGQLNDLASAEAMLSRFAGIGSAPTAGAHHLLLDQMRTEAEAHWSDARKLWQGLRRSPKFWR